MSRADGDMTARGHNSAKDTAYDRERGTDMNKLKKRQTSSACMECGAIVPDEHGLAGYHPFLFCELVKLGHRDPAAYLAQYGFTRG